MAPQGKKYLFNTRDFSDNAIIAAIEAAKNATPPPPMFSEAELEAAQKRGYKEGYNQATQDHKAALETQLTSVFDELKRQINVLLTSETVRSARFENDAAKLAVAMFKHLYPIMFDGYAEDQLVKDLGDLLERNRDQDKIMVKISPDMADLVQTRFAGIEGVSIQSDPNLARGDASLLWPSGGVDLDRRALFDDMVAQVHMMMTGETVAESTAPMSETDGIHADMTSSQEEVESDT